MKTQSKIQWAILIISLIVLGESLAVTAMPSYNNEGTANPDLFHIGGIDLTITVSEDEFNPSTFTIKESTHVNLTVESVDVGHTFEIEEYGIEKEISANSSVTFEFTANRIGTFTYSSINCSATGTMIVESAYIPTLPRPENVTVMFDFKHCANYTIANEKFSRVINWTQDNNFTVEINNENELVESTLENVDVLIIFEPEEDFTEFETEDVLSFVRNGGGMLIDGSRKRADSNLNELTNPFGFQVVNASATYINATNLEDPIGVNNTLTNFTLSEFKDLPIFTENVTVPLTEKTITTINYMGALLEFNETLSTEWLNNEGLLNEGELIHCYTLAKGNETIYADDGDGVVEENETRGNENVFLSAAETSENGRVVGLGSAAIFNDSSTGRKPVNTKLYQRTLQWLAKMYAVLESQDFTLEELEIKKDEETAASIQVYAENNTVLEDLNVTLRFFRIENVEKTVQLTTTNNSFYECEFGTPELHEGTVALVISAHKEGYGYNLSRTIYLRIYPASAEKLPVPIPYLLAYILTSLIGFVAIGFLLMRIIQKPAAEEETDLELDEEEETELTSEELEEYEVPEDELDEYETPEEE
jgi:plastocyanin